MAVYERGQSTSGKQLARTLLHETARKYIDNCKPIPPDLSNQLGVLRREMTDVVMYEREKNAQTRSASKR